MKSSLIAQHYQVTEWSRPGDTVNIIVHQRTATIPYHRWCQREVERWKATNDRESWVQQNSRPVVLEDMTVAQPGEAIALFAHAEYQRPVED